MQTHLSPSLLPETHWEWADGQRWEWRGRVERLLCRSVQLQWTRTHLCQLVEGSREGLQLWTAPPHWVPACLQRSPPLPTWWCTNSWSVRIDLRGGSPYRLSTGLVTMETEVRKDLHKTTLDSLGLSHTHTCSCEHTSSLHAAIVVSEVT